MSGTLSRTPRPTSPPASKMLEPPTCAAAAWKLPHARGVSAGDAQAPLQASGDDGRAVDGQVDPDHRALDADLLDEGAAPPQRLEAAAEPILQLPRAGEQVVLVDGLDGGEGGAA